MILNDHRSLWIVHTTNIAIEMYVAFFLNNQHWEFRVVIVTKRQNACWLKWIVPRIRRSQLESANSCLPSRKRNLKRRSQFRYSVKISPPMKVIPFQKNWLMAKLKGSSVFANVSFYYLRKRLAEKTWRNGILDFPFPVRSVCRVFFVCERWFVVFAQVIKTPIKTCVLIGGNQQKPSLSSRVPEDKFPKQHWVRQRKFFPRRGNLAICAHNLACCVKIFHCAVVFTLPGVERPSPLWIALLWKRTDYSEPLNFAFLRHHGENVSSLSESSVPQKVQLHSLPSSPGEPWRTYFKGKPTIFIENQCTCAIEVIHFRCSWQQQPYWFYSFYFSRFKAARVGLTCSIKCKFISSEITSFFIFAVVPIFMS